MPCFIIAELAVPFPIPRFAFSSAALAPSPKAQVHAFSTAVGVPLKLTSNVQVFRSRRCLPCVSSCANVPLLGDATSRAAESFAGNEKDITGSAVNVSAATWAVPKALSPEPNNSEIP